MQTVDIDLTQNILKTLHANNFFLDLNFRGSWLKYTNINKASIFYFDPKTNKIKATVKEKPFFKDAKILPFGGLQLILQENK